LKKFISIALAVIVLLGIIGYFAFNYISNKAFDTLINSVSDSPSLKQSANQQEPPKSEEETGKTEDEAEPQASVAKTPATPEPSSENDIISNFSNKKIDFQDRKEALSLVYSKLSSSEISMIQSKMQGKLTSQDINEIKALIKSRFSQQDIDKIIYWYNKYK